MTARNLVSFLSPKTKGRPRSFDRNRALMIALRIFWKLGYEPASVAVLCEAMGINPPSFYAAFKSKEELFLEAVNFYEARYWTDVLKQLEESTKPVDAALAEFFQEAASILLNPENPSGCMVVLAAVNIAPKEKRIAEAVKKLRSQTRDFFERRLKKAQDAGEISVKANLSTLADALNIMLEGMSIQAKDDIPLQTLRQAVRHVPNLLRPYLQQTQHEADAKSFQLQSHTLPR